jgi:hypothetical protein
MDMESPTMENITVEMRATMQRWLANPGDEVLKARFAQLQQRYQQLFLELTKGAPAP